SAILTVARSFVPSPTKKQPLLRGTEKPEMPPGIYRLPPLRYPLGTYRLQQEIHGAVLTLMRQQSLATATREHI
ncbi:MAG: hypothetical protein LBD93_05680, partial [Treponema sp.]|nr:hypothetical protein [Treponema sp.]